MSTVSVRHAAGSYTTFSKSVADVFNRDELTITSEVTLEMEPLLVAGEWLEAIVYDEDGYEIYRHRCSAAARKEVL